MNAESTKPELDVTPQTCNCGCTDDPTASATPRTTSYVYALGRVEARFPSLAVEKEYAQIAGRSNAEGQTDRQLFRSVLSEAKNRYLARRLCWVLLIQGLETYLLRPQDALDLDLLVDSLRSAPTPGNIDAVIGSRGSLASPEMCNGLMLPVVVLSQIYSFDRQTLISAIPRNGETAPETFDASANELFDRVMQLTDNAGATDSHRALNYLAMRYPEIYALVADAHARNASLTAVEVRPSSLSGTRNIVEAIFTFTNRNNEFTEKSFARVDVTEEFPFLVTRMAPYYDR